MFNRRKVKELEGKIEILERLLKSQEPLVQENAKLNVENSNLISALNEAKAKVHKQTEADIYFASAKIMKELENGTKKKELQKQIDYRDRSLAGLEAQRGIEASRAYSPLAGALSGLGRGFPY